jgi:two-component system OmpR family response regulator
LPDIDGFSVSDRLRTTGRRIPVVFLTARDRISEKISGLARGDDFVTKPFSLEEMLARVRTVLRRTNGGDPAARLKVADLEMDEDAYQVWRGGRPVRLSPTEFALLRYFMINQGRVLSKAQILDHVWRYDFGGDYNVVESYVSYLRRKIDKADPKLIHTLRGVGYVMRPQSG